MPGVGKNLQDHLQFIMTYNSKEPTSIRQLNFTFPLEIAKWRKNPDNSPLMANTSIPVGGFVKLRLLT